MRVSGTIDRGRLSQGVSEAIGTSADQDGDEIYNFDSDEEDVEFDEEEVEFVQESTSSPKAQTLSGWLARAK